MKIQRRVLIVAIIVLVLGFILGIFVITTQAAEVKADKDFKIVKQLAGKYKKPIKVFDADKTSKQKQKMLVEHRKGKNYVLVEKNTSVSRGNYGLVAGKWITCYNKWVEPGKKVVSYYIYNPKTNYIDDVVYVIDNGKWR